MSATPIRARPLPARWRESPQLAAHWRLTTHRAQTVDEYGVFFVNLFQMNGIDRAR